MFCGPARDARLGAVASRCGLSVFLFVAGVMTARAQVPAAVPAAPSVVAAKQTPPPAPPRPTTASEYTVAPEDLLDVVVMDVPEVSRTYRVSSNGMLSLPLLSDPVPASGLTLDQLSRLIATRFREAGMLSNAQVSISVRDTRQSTVLVSGEVHHPQAYPVYGPTHLLDVIIQCGGVTDLASDTAIITRGAMGARAELGEGNKLDASDPAETVPAETLNIRKLLQTGDDPSNVLLYPGDRVMVQRAALVYVMGAVQRPGGYVLNESRQNMTVLKALAMAGDVNGVAKKSHIMLLRHEPGTSGLAGEKRQQIPINYKAMVKGQIADMRMNADDILYVPESAGIKALRTGTTTAISVGSLAFTDALIYH